MVNDWSLQSVDSRLVDSNVLTEHSLAQTTTPGSVHVARDMLLDAADHLK